MIKILIFNNANTASIISWAGLCSGLLGIGVSVVTAWISTWRNAKVIGVFSGIEFEKMNLLGKKDIKLTGVVRPYFFLKNVGARPAVIENIRLKFCFSNTFYFAYATSNWVEKEIEKKFIGLMLPFNEAWENNLSFKSEVKNYHENLIVMVIIELKFINKKRWISVGTNDSNFFFTPEDLQIERTPNGIYGDVQAFDKPVFKSFKSNSNPKEGS